MRRTAFVVVAGLVSLAACSRETEPKFTSIRKDVDAGRCDQVAQMDPMKVDAEGQPRGEIFYLIGFCNQIGPKNNAKALEYYNRALQEGGSPFWIFYNRGQLYMTQGDMMNARDDIEKAASMNPNHPGIPGLLTQVRGAATAAAPPADSAASAAVPAQTSAPATDAPAPVGDLQPPPLPPAG